MGKKIAMGLFRQAIMCMITLTIYIMAWAFVIGTHYVFNQWTCK